jgi:hypothetical protein
LDLVSSFSLNLGLFSRKLGCAMIETFEPCIWFSFEQKGRVFNLTGVRKNYVKRDDCLILIVIRYWSYIRNLPVENIMKEGKR